MPAIDSLARMLARPIAHRGLHACGAPGPVENTLAAASAAMEADYGIECDVLFARDGTPVVVHDETLDRLAGRSAAIADLDAEAIGAILLRGGSTVPTLDALLRLVDGRVALVVEIKTVPDASRADAVLELVARYAGAVVLESFDPAIVERCRYAACPVGLVGPSRTTVDAAALPRCDFVSWSVGHLDLRPAALPVTTWTVRSIDDAAQAAAAGAQIVFEGWRP